MKMRSLLNGSFNFTQSLLQSFEHATETIVLNQKQQFFFRFAVVIETGEADVRRARDVAHGGRVIILLGKNARRIAEDKLQLLIVIREILHDFGFRTSDFELVLTLLEYVTHVLSLGSNQSQIRQSQVQVRILISRTYSNSNGLPLIPVAGGAIQLAILPGSITGCIRLRTYSRSSIVGSHSDFALLKLFRADQVALDVEMVTGVFADVTVKTRVR